MTFVVVQLVRENHGPGVPRRREEEGMKTAGFDEEQFMKNGPHQQGTIKIDRSKLQTVVTICSPTLLQMAVYDDVDLASVQKYDQSSDAWFSVIPGSAAPTVCIT